ncbi:GNAT family N-acetyltransferase [Tenacibaculum sp. HL-MS23]|uniref:GNAT family N-acetyltransferase n=1 Tax=Tenacibaculum sp. HL-MS23 TaxID=3077734 RepID=UPI0028FC0F68|nr:GNAT family N-acetyltransferase [Tenacibaculum sp. HL-MS23]WNW02420.1 GNAT family N-acetyltransferase [Tenacibaculum sp. HL-MS23]
MITFKLATTSDTEVIALLGRITYTESHGHFIDDKNDLLAYCANAFSIKKIIEELEDKNNLFHIAYVDDLPVGFSKVVLNYPFEDKTGNSSARLERIYILNQFLPLKIGQPFLDFIIDKVKEKNATVIWLSVYIKNERGIRFYNRNEFKNIGELNFNVNGKEYDNYVLSKEI